MKAFLALLIDSWRELLDKRSLLVLFLVFGVVVVAVSSLTFEARSIEEVLEAQSKEIHEFSANSLSNRFTSHVQFDYSAERPRRADSTETLPFTTRDTWFLDYRLQHDYDLNAPILSWRSLQTYKQTRKWPPPPSAEESARITAAFTDADRTGFFAERFQAFGYEHVQARRVGDQPPVFRVFVHTDFPQEISGVKLGILFGARKFPLNDISIPELLVTIQSTLANTIVGFVGMLLFVSVCAPFIPNLLQKGTLDLLLARPIGRVRLLLFKYLGAVAFVCAASGTFLLTSWVALSLRSGYWNPWFLLCIVTMTALFAVVHSVNVLAGVLTRNANLSVVIALGVWFFSSTIGALRQTAATLFEDLPRIKSALDIAYHALPKIGDLTTLNSVFLSRSHLSPAAIERRFGNLLPDIDWVYSTGTTLAFTVAVLALAAWHFRRRDF